MNLNLELLLKEGHGAVEIDASPNIVPPIITLIGPIKIWWTEWDSPRHKVYTEWRDIVRVALVKSGCAVYSPHRAIQGSWNEKLQFINDAAIKASTMVVVLTPDDVEANGTKGEIQVAVDSNVTIYYCPPGTEEDLLKLIETINQL